MGVFDPKLMQTDLLICVDERNPLKYHALKLVAKLREIYDRDNSFVFYKEYGYKAHSEEDKLANQYSFIINSLLFN